LPLGSNPDSLIISPAPQNRPQQTSQSATTFSPAAREFIPSGLAYKDSTKAVRDGS
jgi:hypothetical protein